MNKNYGYSVRCMQNNGISGLDLVREHKEIILAPNPCRGDFKIHLEKTDHMLMSIYDLTGSLVISQWLLAVDNLIRIPSSVNPGFYIVKINDINGVNVFNEKLNLIK